MIESRWSRNASFFWRSMLKSNAWIRTTDLWVMSPVRIHCATLFLIMNPKKLNGDQNSKISKNMSLFVTTYLSLRLISKLQDAISFQEEKNTYSLCYIYTFHLLKMYFQIINKLLPYGYLSFMNIWSILWFMN